MQTIDWKDEFYSELLKITEEFGTVWVCDTSDIYRTEQQAIDRQRFSEKELRGGDISGLIRYCKIEKGNEPLDNTEMELRMRNSIFEQQRAAMKDAEVKSATVELPKDTITNGLDELKRRREQRNAKPAEHKEVKTEKMTKK